jgi:MFS family permease
MRRVWPHGGLWRHADFLRLWGAQTVSQLGSQVSQLAIPLVAIIVLHASAFEVAVLGAIEFLPFTLFALPAGVWVDRLPRRPILVVADVGRALLLASIPLAYALDVLTIWQLYAVGFAVGVCTVFFDVAYQSYLPSLVERDQLVDGNSKLEISRSGAQIGGPGLGGILVSALTAPFAVLVDALSFAWSALLVWRIRTHEEHRVPEAAPSMRREVAEGLRYIFGDPRWRAIALYVATFNFLSNVAFSIYLVYAVRELHLSAALIGVIFAVGNTGWLVGAVLASRVSRRLGIGRTLTAAALLTGAPNLLIPLAPQSFPIPFLIAAGIVVTFGVVIYNVTGISLMQALTPDRMLGRMNASRRWVVWGTIPLGNVTGGVLATTIGLRETLFVGTIGLSFTFLFLLFSPLRSIDRLPDQPAAPDELIPLPLEA